MNKHFDPHQYTVNAGWDYTNIEATAEQGVSIEDRDIIEEMGFDWQDDGDALEDYCKRSVDSR